MRICLTSSRTLEARIRKWFAAARVAPRRLKFRSRPHRRRRRPDQSAASSSKRVSHFRSFVYPFMHVIDANDVRTCTRSRERERESAIRESGLE